MAKKRRRGVSFGTIFITLLTIATLAACAVVFLRISISGDLGSIQLDPRQLAESPGAPTELVAPPQAEIVTAPPAIAPEQAPGPTATPTPSKTIRIAAVGQVSAGADLRAGGRESSGVYSFSSVFSGVSGALSADLSIATLRTGLTSDSGAFDAYNTASTLANALDSSGVTLLNLATDRVLDHGISGLSETLNALGRLNLNSVGGYQNDETRNALDIFDVGGVQVAVLAYTEALSATGKKEADDTEIRRSTRKLEMDAVAADISAARIQGADIVVVLAHWGNAADTRPSQETRQMAANIANAGADIILGTNPLSVHEMERLTLAYADGTPREVFVAYSLGNFLTDESRETANITGVVLNLAITWDSQTQRMSLDECRYMPTWIMRWRGTSGANQFRIIPAGTNTIPGNMSDSIYINMKKAYQNLVARIGADQAQPYAEP